MTTLSERSGSPVMDGESSSGDVPSWLVGRFVVSQTGGCWVWQGCVTEDGYAKAEQTTYHRKVYEEMVGPIPSDRQIHHVCENPPCVNPDHLVAITPAMHGRVSARARKRYCAYGHEFTPENTAYNRAGARACRACNARRQRETRNRRAAK